MNGVGNVLRKHGSIFLFYHLCIIIYVFYYFPKKKLLFMYIIWSYSSNIFRFVPELLQTSLNFERVCVIDSLPKNNMVWNFILTEKKMLNSFNLSKFPVL